MKVFICLLGIFAGFIAEARPNQEQQVAGSALIGGEYSLVDNTGKPVTDKSYLGKYSLVFFGFTHCPSVCPLGLQRMSAALSGIEKFEQKLTPLFISVDPERDTLERMTTYLAKFNAHFVGLTGSETQIEHVSKVFRAYYVKSQDPNSEQYSYDHSSIIYLMDKQGKYVTHFADTTPIKAMRETIRNHIETN